MNIVKFDKQKGIGLIEVLVTMLVIAIGLLAVASLQGSLMFNSGNNKIRSEALTRAEELIEQLRNNIEVGEAGGDGYIGDNAPGTFNDAIVGTNADFTRFWNISDTGSFLGPSRKKISVLVGWDADGNGESGATDDERVVLVSEMAWNSPNKSATAAAAASGGTGAVPSPRQNASEDVASENVIGTDLTITDLDINTSGTSGVDATVSVDPDEDDGGGNFITLSQVAPGSHFYTATHDELSSIEAGVIAVFLCSDEDNDTSNADTCNHIQNHFGGVVLTHTGTVFSSSGNGLGDIRVAWTSSEINACYNAPPDTQNGFDTMSYECVFAGNCDATPDAERTRTATGAGSTNPGCFVQSVVSNAQISSRNVGTGGEFGDVGLLGLNDTGRGTTNREEVCFLEDTTLPTTPTSIIAVSGQLKTLNPDFLAPVTKRLYVSRRIKNVPSSSTFEQSSEGINRSYKGHSFLVIERDNTNTISGSCHQIAVDNNIGLAPRTISRVFNESNTNDNIVLPEITQTYHYYDFVDILNGTQITGGGAAVIYGDVTADATDLKLYIEERGSCYVNSTSTDYACVTAPYVTSTYTSFDQTKFTTKWDYIIDSDPDFDGKFEQAVVENGVQTITTGFANTIRGGSLTHATTGALASVASCLAGPANPPADRGKLPADITTPDTNCVWPARF